LAKLGAGSIAELGTCHEDLQRIVRLVVSRLPPPYDLKVVCGWRDKAAQEAAFAAGNTTKHFPASHHNVYPSRAVDLVMYPVDWSDVKMAAFLAGAMFCAASELGLHLRWGGDWNRNGKTTDETFGDLPHFELA
jgi:peptidoglycan L-alanyl-D-glutamate endopeptidase CwlK